MCKACGCGKKKGEAGYGKGAKGKKKASDDTKYEKGMTPAQKEKFKNKDDKNDKDLAEKIKKSK